MIAYEIDNIMKLYYAGQISSEQEKEELRRCVSIQNFNIAIGSLEKIASLDESLLSETEDDKIKRCYPAK